MSEKFALFCGLVWTLSFSLPAGDSLYIQYMRSRYLIPLGAPASDAQRLVQGRLPYRYIYLALDLDFRIIYAIVSLKCIIDSDIFEYFIIHRFEREPEMSLDV